MLRISTGARFALVIMLLVSGCGYRAIGLSFAPAEQTLSTPVTDRPLPLSERDLAEPIVLAQVATDPSGGSMKVDSGLMPGRQTEGGTDDRSADGPSGSALLASGRFRLNVPWHTQKDGDRFQGSNCGPAALAMILDGFGMSRTNGDLRFLMHTYQGTVGMRTGTALQHVAHVGQDLGLQPIGLYNGTDFTRWTVDDVRRELMAGRPVIPLVKYRLLPGHEESTVRFDHYVVIHGVDGDRFLYHDPSYGNELEGSSLWITADQLDAAMRIASVPRQAVAFAPGAHAALSALPV